MTDHKDLIELARRAKGSELLPKVLLGNMNAEVLILRLADALEAAQSRIEELEAELMRVPRLCDWADRADDLTEAVNADHPLVAKTNWDHYAKAIELVSNRHGKGALVALVCHLLAENERACASMKGEPK